MKFIKFFKKKKLFISLAILASALGFLVVIRLNKNPELNLHTVGFGDIKQELSFTGKVKSSEEAELSFEKNGRVERVFFKVGDHVDAGEILATLDSSSSLADMEKAKATLASEGARLEELKMGPRQEEISVYLAKLNAAEINVEEARKSLVDKIREAYTKSDDALHNQVDQIFVDPKSQTPRLNISPIDSQLKSDLESSRVVIGISLGSWENSLVYLSSSSDLVAYVKKAKENLDSLRIFLDKVSSAVNSMTVSSSFSQTVIDGYKTDISTARTNINLAVSNLTSVQEKLVVSQANLVLAEKELSLAKAGSTVQEIQAQEAKVLQAKAGVSSAEAELSKTIIRSPISGTVTQISISVGEIAGANKNALTIISDTGFEIEANVTEIDIAKIKINELAKVTLDAYGPETEFLARVASVDPAETIIEGVSTYKTKFVFEKNDERIKSGMTANIEIEIKLGESVLVIPQKAVEVKGNLRIVKIYEFKKIVERELRLGQRGVDGSVEVLEGLKAGDLIILP